MAAERVGEGDFLKGETPEVIYNLMDEDALDSFFENDIDVIAKEVGFLFDAAFSLFASFSFIKES